MRFAGPRTEGLTEEIVAAIDDDHESCALLEPEERAALLLTDALIGEAKPPDASARAALRAHWSGAQIAELALGVALFHALSKTLIALGLEPESMPVTLLPTPDSPP